MCHRKWDLIGIFAWHGKSCKTLLHSVGRAQFVQGTKLQCQNRRIPLFSLKQVELTLQDTKAPKRLYQLPHRRKISTYHAKNNNGCFFVTARSVFTEGRQYKEAQSLSLAWALAWVFGGRAWRCQNSLQIHVHSLARGNDPWCLVGFCEQFLPSNTKN